MGFISEILGALWPSDAEPAPRTIADVEAALSRLAGERKAAREAVAAAMQARDELLVVDETDKKIAALDATADKHRLTLERLDKIEPRLVGELQGLRDARRRQAWQD